MVEPRYSPFLSLLMAALFPHFYRECRILGVDSEVTQARLGLITAVQYVLVHALTILGITAPEKM